MTALLPGATDGPRHVPPLRHRRQSRPVRRHSLYPGQTPPGCARPTDFRRKADLARGAEPDDRRYREPAAAFHRALSCRDGGGDRAAEGRARRAILYDCHSIRSVVPFLFEGTLPDFNIGTNDGKSCAIRHRAAVDATICAAQPATPMSSTAASRAAGSRAITAGPGWRPCHPDGADAGDASRKRGAPSPIRPRPYDCRLLRAILAELERIAGRLAGRRTLTTQFPKEMTP